MFVHNYYCPHRGSTRCIIAYSIDGTTMYAQICPRKMSMPMWDLEIIPSASNLGSNAGFQLNQPSMYLVRGCLPARSRMMPTTYIIHISTVRVSSSTFSAGRKQNDAMHPLRQKAATTYIIHISTVCVSSSTFSAGRKQNDAMHPLRQKAATTYIIHISTVCVSSSTFSAGRKQNDAMHPLRQKAATTYIIHISTVCVSSSTFSAGRKQNDAMHPLRQKATYYIYNTSTVRVSSYSLPTGNRTMRCTLCDRRLPTTYIIHQLCVYLVIPSLQETERCDAPSASEGCHYIYNTYINCVCI